MHTCNMHALSAEECILEQRAEHMWDPHVQNHPKWPANVSQLFSQLAESRMQLQIHGVASVHETRCTADAMMPALATQAQSTNVAGVLPRIYKVDVAAELSLDG